MRAQSLTAIVCLGLVCLVGNAAAADVPVRDKPFGEYRPWGVARFAFAEETREGAGESEGVNVYGGEAVIGDAYFAAPRSVPAQTDTKYAALERLTVTSLGVAWRHQLAAQQQLNVSAQYDDLAYDTEQARTASGYSAALGWRGASAGSGRARIGGSVFLGEESVDQTARKYFGRRYFGVSADGSYVLFKDHSPFVSLRLQRSDYDEEDPSYLARRSEDYSQFAAGWNWQVQPSWHIRAQAEYALNKSNLSLYQYDANRLFFTTRFDFR